jgi:hypothetical protein
LLGEVPPLARRSLRALNDGGAVAKDRFLMGLLEQPSYKMSLCELLTMLGEQASPIAQIGDLVRSRSSKELVSFIVCSFLEGKLKTLAPEAVQELSNTLKLQRSVGTLLGKASGRIGLSTAMLVGPLRIASYVLMAHTAKVPFARYKKVLDERSVWCALEEEERLWGCSHYQVAGQLLTIMGLPAELGKDVSTALSVPLSADLPETQAKIRIAAVWTECLSRGIELPEVKGEDAFMMEESDMDKLLNAVNDARMASGS